MSEVAAGNPRPRAHMSTSKARYTRRQRRKVKARLRHSPKAAPKHKLIAGRTGSLHHKKPKARATAFVIFHPPLDLGSLIEALYAVGKRE